MCVLKGRIVDAKSLLNIQPNGGKHNGTGNIAGTWECVAHKWKHTRPINFHLNLYSIKIESYFYLCSFVRSIGKW